MNSQIQRSLLAALIPLFALAQLGFGQNSTAGSPLSPMFSTQSIFIIEIIQLIVTVVLFAAVIALLLDMRRRVPRRK